MSVNNLTYGINYRSMDLEHASFFFHNWGLTTFKTGRAIIMSVLCKLRNSSNKTSY